MCVGAPVGTADMNSIINGLSLRRVQRDSESSFVESLRFGSACGARGGAGGPAVPP